MKKNYLKPLCATAPMDGLQLMNGSIQVDGSKIITTTSDGGWAREMVDEPTGVPSQNSVWDD
ncbi:MAG: hypothetical protein J5971_08295 [Prevotella sp.]|nr:hypothetical protein [Prevotella sp.]